MKIFNASALDMEPALTQSFQTTFGDLGLVLVLGLVWFGFFLDGFGFGFGFLVGWLGWFFFSFVVLVIVVMLLWFGDFVGIFHHMSLFRVGDYVSIK